MTTAGMPWIKIYTDILDDAQFSALSLALKWRFVELCVVAGECDAEGYFANGQAMMSTEDIAWRLRCIPGELDADLEILRNKGYLSQDPDEHLFVTNFAKRQGRPQYKKRRRWRERKRRQREAETDDQAGDTPETPGNVTGDSRGTPGPREEENREEKRARDKPATPLSVAVFRENAYRYPAKSWYKDVAKVVGEKERDLEFWGQVVKKWVGMGWNPTNVTGMLDMYSKGELPGGAKRVGSVIKVGG